MSKVALIIGGTGGLGVASAEDLAKDHVVVIAGRRKEKGDAVVDKITSSGGKGAFISVDLLEPASITSLHEKVLETYGRLDVALNAAGILAPSAKLADTDKADFDRSMAINVTGVYLAMVEQIRAMQKSPGEKGGVIVNLTSIYGLTGCKWASIYCTSAVTHAPQSPPHIKQLTPLSATTKHALVGLTRSAAAEYALDNIRISAVAPGIVPTEMTAGMDPSALPEGELRDDVLAIINAYPQRMLGEVTDVSRAVRYLVESPWTTGAVIEVDGAFGAKR